MKNPRVFKTIDGCEAAAYVAFRLNEAMAIYPITPSSPIADLPAFIHSQMFKPEYANYCAGETPPAIPVHSLR